MFFAETFRGLGQQMHLVQDMAVPAHTRNDAHPLDALAGTNSHGHYLETWTKTNVSTLNDLKAIAPNPAMPQLVFTSPADPALAPITNFFDTNQYDGTNPSTSASIGLSEYTNANYFSDDTINLPFYNQDTEFPYPNKDSTNLQAYINEELLPETIVAEDGTPDVSFWIKKIGPGGEVEVGHFAKPGYTTNEMEKIQGNENVYSKTFFLDDECHHDYASKLIPRAVGYSAGLLNYFFRGELDVINDPDNVDKYIIKNLSNENMTGTFSLYYDDEDDNRILITSWTLSINANDQSDGVTFTTPTYPKPKEKNKYILVFQGALGSETSAVAGRALELKPPISARVVIASDAPGSRGKITVYTEKGAIEGKLPTIGGFSPTPMAARFDQDDWNTFMILTKIYVHEDSGYKSYHEFHKYTIDEPALTLNYHGIVLREAAGENNETENMIYEYLSPDLYGGYRVYQYQISGSDAGYIDFTLKGGSIKPFGIMGKSSASFIKECYLDYDWDYSETWYTVWCDYGPDHLIHRYSYSGLYFGEVVLETERLCEGGSYYLYGDPYSAHPHAVITPCQATPDTSYIPAAIFNSADHAYVLWQSSKQLVSTLPIQIPQEVINFDGYTYKIIRTMIREDGKYSFYLETPWGYSGPKSYSSEVGAVNCGGFLIGGKKVGEYYLGWKAWTAELIAFKTCTDWKSLGFMGKSPYQDEVFDVILK